MTIEPFFKYPNKVRLPFEATQIDLLQVRNLFTNEFERCEYLSWNDEGKNDLPYYDFGTITECLDFEIYRNKTRFFSGEGLVIVGKVTYPFHLTISTDRLVDRENERILRGFSPELIIPQAPETMVDFMRFISDFRWQIRDAFHSIARSGKIERECVERKKEIIPDDLPF